jgi:hypothetical protein
MLRCRTAERYRLNPWVPRTPLGLPTPRAPKVPKTLRRGAFILQTFAKYASPKRFPPLGRPDWPAMLGLLEWRSEAFGYQAENVLESGLMKGHRRKLPGLEMIIRILTHPPPRGKTTLELNYPPISELCFPANPGIAKISLIFPI